MASIDVARRPDGALIGGRVARSTRADWLSIGAVVVVCAIAILSIALPVASTGFDWARSHQEGWNAYHAGRAAAGETLYAGDFSRSVNYPFLSFYLVAWLKPLFGNLVIIGRSINLISLACLVVCGALIVRRLGGRGLEMVFAAAAVLGFVQIQAAAWIAVDEPQMLAEALSFAGLLCYLSGRPTLWRLAASALLCCAAGFTKPITAAIPISVAIDLLWRDRRLFLIWCLCGFGALALFTALTYAIAGGDFISEVFARRHYYWREVWHHAGQFGRWLKIPIGVCLIYLCQRLPPDQSILLRVLFASALVVGIAVSGGEGVSSNAFMEMSVLMGIIAALALGRWRDKLNVSRAGRLAGAVLPIVLALPVATRLPPELGPLWNLEHTWRGYELHQAEFRRAAEFVSQQPGDALCDTLLMCFEAGKPLIIEPFTARANILAHSLDEAQLTGMFGQQRFAVIELPDLIFPYPDRPDRFADALTRIPRFTPNMLRAIDRFYAPALSIGRARFYLPKDTDISRGD